MSKSNDNLKSAFAGESQANRRYLAFAKKADEEGHPQAARLFRAAAAAETVHALNHFRAAGGINDTTANLQTAIQGEHYEVVTMYPPFIEEADTENEIANVKAQIAGLEETKKSLNVKKNLIDHNEMIQAGLDKLKAEQKEINIKLDGLQRLMDLTKKFLEEKSRQTLTAISGMFELVEWKLFDYTLEGDLREVCIPMVNGVEYPGLSYSTKLLAGIDIIKTFQKVYNCYLPICVDNSESINFDQSMNNQMIFLTRVEENCPECSGQAGRRNGNGTWTCRKCGHTWKKKFDIVTE
jgi:rubrerythrin